MAQQSRLGRRATTLQRDPKGAIRVTYHETTVVEVRPNGTVVLDSGGWRTQTTKTRMNQASHQLGLCFSVYASRGTWYVDCWRSSEDYDNRVTCLFADGMKIPKEEARPCTGSH